MTFFSKKVIRLIQKIPRGRVASYRQIAALAGNSQGSRGVSWILHSCTKSHALPWHRVINSQGKISFPWGTPSYDRQRKLLLKEAVEVSPSGRINLEKFGWKKKSRS